MTVQEIDINVIPGGVMPMIKLNQYDMGLGALKFNIYEGDTVFSMPENATINIQGTKPDKTGFSYECICLNNVVTASVMPQMTVLAGLVVTEIVVFDKDRNRIASGNFILAIEPAALSDDTKISETELPDIIAMATEQMQRAERAANNASESKSNAAKSEENARISEENAKILETNAKVSETNAKASETKASSSADSASSSASDASASATNAAGSASSAQSYAEDAHGWADNKGDSGENTYSATNNAFYWAMYAASAAGAGLKPVVVQTLPTSNILTSAMYFVPSSDPEAKNYYDEYINLDGTVEGYERVGTTSIDLSGYVEKSSIANNLTTTANGYVLDARQGGVLLDLIKNLSTKLSFANGTNSDLNNQKFNITNTTTGETTLYTYKDGEKVYLTRHGDYTITPQDDNLYVTPHTFTLDYTKTTETIEITVYSTKVKAYVGGYVGAYVSSNN